MDNWLPRGTPVIRLGYSGFLSAIVMLWRMNRKCSPPRHQDQSRNNPAAAVAQVTSLSLKKATERDWNHIRMVIFNARVQRDLHKPYRERKPWKAHIVRWRMDYFRNRPQRGLGESIWTERPDE